MSVARSLRKIGDGPDAVFAIGPTDRIVLWNERCETLVGVAARDAVGRPCWEVLGGHDVHGNLYCYRTCPIAFAARRRTPGLIRGTVLDVTAGGAARRLQVATFVLPGDGGSTIVHVLSDPASSHRADERPARPVEGAEAKPVEGVPIADRRGPLTAREREILRCLAEGLETREIAGALDITSVTVRNHVARILTKLGVHTKLSAVVYGYRNGLLSPDGASPIAIPSDAVPAAELAPVP